MWVNLLFSTDTPWLRVRSEVPRTGRLRLEMLQEERVRVRLPDWIPAETVRVDGAGAPDKTRRRENTLDLGPLAKGSRVSVTFDQPGRRTRERAPGFADPFEVDWRGDTIVGHGAQSLPAHRSLLTLTRISDRKNWSGREDLNLRPPAPKAGALPGCATPRPACRTSQASRWAHGCQAMELAPVSPRTGPAAALAGLAPGG